MDLPNDVVGCDYCEHTSEDSARVIYGCDTCGADVCSDCSSNNPEDSSGVLCDPDQSLHPGRSCVPATRPEEEQDECLWASTQCP